MKEKNTNININAATPRELIDYNLNLENKLFSAFVEADYEKMKLELSDKIKKQRQIQNYIWDSIEETGSVEDDISEAMDIIKNNIWKAYESGYTMALYSIMSRISEYKNKLIDIKNINSSYVDDIVKVLYEKDVMKHSELSEYLHIKANNLTNIIKRIEKSSADIFKTEKNGKYKIYYLTDNGIRYAKKIISYEKNKRRTALQKTDTTWKMSRYEDFNVDLFCVNTKTGVQGDVKEEFNIWAIENATEFRTPIKKALKFKNIQYLYDDFNLKNKKEMNRNGKQFGEISKISRRNMERGAYEQILCGESE